RAPRLSAARRCAGARSRRRRAIPARRGGPGRRSARQRRGNARARGSPVHLQLGGDRMSEGFLEQMARGSAARVAQAKARLAERDVRALAASSPEPVPLALHAAGFDVIAEMKLRSPAAGKLATESEATAGRVGGYARAGAAAVSVLTEPSRFDGAMEHLE